MKNKMKSLMICLLLSGISCGLANAQTRWPEEKANDWYNHHVWLVGCNFIPSTAINQLEMWQADSFDPTTIDRELGWAEGLGFTSVRVFLQNLPWQQDPKGFLIRMDQFLAIAHQHHIGVMFVLFDSCWDPDPKLGKQRAPKPFVHNSGWVQSPGREFTANPARLEELKSYVQGVVGRFRNDERIDFWDVYNEPDNYERSCLHQIGTDEQSGFRAVAVAKNVRLGARNETVPAAVIRVVVGAVGRSRQAFAHGTNPTGEFGHHHLSQLRPLDKLKSCVENLRRYHRPIICTEYMARPVGSTFDPNLRYLKEQNVGAYNWGFVSGKTQTIFPWDSWTKTYSSEPPVWFHDIFHADGTPYKADEVQFIKSLTGAQ